MGKRALIGGLVQGFDDGSAPAFLDKASLVEFDLPPWGAITGSWFQSFREAVTKAAEEGAILLVDDLHTPVEDVNDRNAVHLRQLLKRAVVGGELQCISVAMPAAYARSIADHR